MVMVCALVSLLLLATPVAAQDDAGSGGPDSGGETAKKSEQNGADEEEESPEAPEPATPEQQHKLLETDVEAAAYGAHNAWMLTCSALVLFMTAPGLAMFYGGLVRKKNVLSVLMQCLFLMGLMTVIWALYGYSLAFGGDPGDEESGYNPWVGTLEYVFMQNVQAEWSEKGREPFADENDNGSHNTGEYYVDVNGNGEYDEAGPYVPMEGSIPRLTHMLFQGMFFIITPALICGAFAERMKFSTMVVFMILWGTLVYCPLCHWVWDGGVLAFGGDWTGDGKVDAYGGGALDFAGGTVVHISSGVSALICALLIGPRLGFGSEDLRPHNLTYTALGAAMLWVGWFGFNAGSQLASDGVAASAFCVTHFSAAAGAIAWAAIEWTSQGKPTILGAASGAVAGLVCITPAAGFVNPMPALLMGAAAGVVCYFACSTLKARFGYDDSLDAFGVHGIGGTLGAVLTGVFATRAVTDMADGGRLGLIEGGTVLVGQIVAVLITWVFAIVVTLIILKVLDATMGLRVKQDEETGGLDFSQHGEEGYIFT